MFLAVLVSLPLIQNHGSFSYPLDDTYIHMVIADNLAHKGVWGINGKEFASASSSILYPIVMAAAFKLTDNQLYVPLYLNIAAAILCLFALNSAMRFFCFGPLMRTLALLTIILCTPLPATALMGMEHTLQILLAIIFVHLAARLLVSSRTDTREHVVLLLFTMLFMSVRYESLFFLPFFLMALLLQRKYLHFITVLAASILPAVIFGTYSIMHGGYFFPNTLIIKSFIDKSQLAGNLQMILDNIRKGATIISLLLMSSFLFFARNYPRIDFKSKSFMVYGLFTTTALIHISLAMVGRFYRYEAYLVPIGLLAVFACLSDGPEKDARSMFSRLRFNRATGALAGLTILCIPVLNNLSLEVVSLKVLPYTVIISVLAIVLTIIIKVRVPGADYRPAIIYSVLFCILISPLIARGVLSQIRVPTAMNNIYEQQYQMGAFVKEYYSGNNVAVNDLGAVSYFGNAHVLDLWGLGDKETLEAKNHRGFNPDFIKRIVDDRGIELLMVYDRWFEPYGGFPETFHKVGKWTIYNNVVCGEDNVSFYAPDRDSARELESNLAAYRDTLPSSVKVELFHVR